MLYSKYRCEFPVFWLHKHINMIFTQHNRRRSVYLKNMKNYANHLRIAVKGHKMTNEQKTENCCWFEGNLRWKWWESMRCSYSRDDITNEWWFVAPGGIWGNIYGTIYLPSCLVYRRDMGDTVFHNFVRKAGCERDFEEIQAF